MPPRRIRWGTSPEGTAGHKALVALAIIAFNVLICFVQGANSPLVWAMYADTADYGEVRWDADVTKQDGSSVAKYDVLTLVAKGE